MGGDLDIICSGEDVLVELNLVFRNPESERYKTAQRNNIFDQVPEKTADNYVQLIKAYRAAGLRVGKGWESYLKQLGEVKVPDAGQGPLNIWTIARFRYDNLVHSRPMSTDVHTPEHGGHVQTGPSLEPGQPYPISSPCPLPPPANH
jgi:hypothetical protein